ncbi:MAG TPA: hypothetical protein VGM82_19320 [Gemmatimonadaceae bacterium]
MIRPGVRIAALAFCVAVTACVPKLTPLSGADVPTSRLPRTQLALGRRKILFNWDMQDGEMSARGDGAARVATPDSARLDFFLAGGFGQGSAVLIGDSLRTPGGIASDLAMRLVPPAPMLWAVLGRVALPNLPDTAIRVEGNILRADIGRPIAWRFTFRGDTLTRAEHVESGRVTEWVERADPTHIRYRSESARRSLQLTVTQTDEVSGFEAGIWQFGR